MVLVSFLFFFLDSFSMLQKFHMLHGGLSGAFCNKFSKFYIEQAKRQRAEYIRQRGRLRGYAFDNWITTSKQAEYLSRKLARFFAFKT